MVVATRTTASTARSNNPSIFFSSYLIFLPKVSLLRLLILLFLIFTPSSSLFQKKKNEPKQQRTQDKTKQQQQQEELGVEECDVQSSSSSSGATVFLHGERIALESSNSPFSKKYCDVYPPSQKNGHCHEESDNETYYYILEESKPILYVRNFLNSTMGEELKQFCIQQNRFVRSPVRSNSNSDGKNNNDQNKDLNTNSLERTSESCALVPAAAYLNYEAFLQMKQQDNPTTKIANIIREVDVSRDIAIRASQLLTGTHPDFVEPLQLVRYTSPSAEYKIHHDHGEFYHRLPPKEYRPWTMLIFLNDVYEGGYTSFPKLGLQVSPRQGDALVWSNVLATDAKQQQQQQDDDDERQPQQQKADPDMIHAGEPPGKEGIEKYAVNVWFSDVSFASMLSDRYAGGKW